MFGRAFAKVSIPDAQIDYHTEFLNPDNIEEVLNGYDVAINALDFKDDTPFVFDRICKEKKNPSTAPIQLWLGWLCYDCRPIGAFHIRIGRRT